MNVRCNFLTPEKGEIEQQPLRLGLACDGEAVCVCACLWRFPALVSEFLTITSLCDIEEPKCIHMTGMSGQCHQFDVTPDAACVPIL